MSLMARNGHAEYLGDVRCWVNSGKHLLSLSFSGFDPTRTYGARLRVQSRSLLELLEQRLRLLKVRRVETLGKPAVDRREEVAGFVALALVAPEADEAGGGAQLPE